MIWIIGGTSEGREIADRIKDLDNYIITAATDESREFIQDGNIRVGRMSYDEMWQFSLENNISLIVDLTHPFAKIVSDNAKKLADQLGIKYVRYSRERVKKRSSSIFLNSYEEAYEYLKDVKGTVFLTTGSKNIADFEKVRGDNRFIYRILPATESMDICKKNNILMKDIVAVLGPFSVKYNMAMFEEYGADYVIMKDSGDKGGTLEKIKACESLNIPAIIIGREEEQGLNDLDQVEKIIREEQTE